MSVEEPKIFFSYARADAEFVLRLAKDLRSAGINLWVDQLDIRAGDRWDSAVERALKRCPYLLVILSPASVASHNVMDEVSVALETKKRIVPVHYRDCEIPFRLKRLQYIDFRGDYNSGFTQLLSALNVEAPAQPSLGKDLRQPASAMSASTASPAETGAEQVAERDPGRVTDVRIPARDSHHERAPRTGFWRSAPGILTSIVMLAGAMTTLFFLGRAMAPPGKAPSLPPHSTDSTKGDETPGRPVVIDAGKNVVSPKEKTVQKDQPVQPSTPDKQNTVTVPVASPVASAGAKVFMHTSQERDRAVLQEIGNTLRAKGYEVPDTRVTSAKTNGDIRFFFPQDRDNAARLKSAIETELDGRGYHVSLALLERDGTQFKSSAPGKIEVWIPPLANGTGSR
jgi:hypothetical protein